MIGFAMPLSIAGVTAPATLTPTNTSAPTSASSSVRAFVLRTNGSFHSFRPFSRPSYSTPWLSHRSRCSGLTPIAMYRFAQPIPAAPAPENTTRTFSGFLPTSSSAFRNAAAEMIAVPCWSSWKTGIAMRFLSSCSM